MNHSFTALLGLLLLGAPLAVCAQGTDTAAPVASTSRLSGTVLDSVKNAPVPYATVALLPATAPDTPITGVAADEQGKFVLSGLKPGSYRLQVSFVGYGTRTRAVTVTAGSTDAGTFRLPNAGTALGEAVVIGSKPVIEVRPDRLVYNADQDVTNAGGTAADVLRKAPLLAVDGDGNVKMRGSANFKVLINNKPSPTMASNLAEALKSIPAEQIQSVELITTPPAKYDGEGTAGIINIVLKKGTQQKLNGRVGVASGNRNTNLNTSLNFRKGKIGFTSSLGGGLWYNPGEFNLQRTSTDAASGAATGYLSQDGNNYNMGGWYYGNVGVDFDPVEHHSFSLTTALHGWGGYNDRTLVNRASGLGAGGDYTRENTNRFRGTNVDLTGSYVRTFEQKRREWSVLGQYAMNPSVNSYDFDQYAGSLVALEPWQATYRERSSGRQPGHETTVQTDYVQPFGEKQTLETGLKAIWRSTGSVADVDKLVPGQDADFVRLPSRGTDFDYEQDVQAAYATYSLGLGEKTTLSLGGRVERTFLKADFRAAADTGFSRSYYTPLPNGNAQYSFSETSSLRLAYSRRITRPYIYYLNPFRDVSQPGIISYGNPNLDPELTDSYELSYNTSFKTTSLNFSASVRHTGNAIEQVRLPTAQVNVTEQTFANVAANTFYEFNVYGSVKPLPKWDISGGPNVRYIVRRSPALNASRRGFTGGLNLNTSYKLPKEFTLQAFLYGGLRDPEIQGTGSANLYYSIGAKKTFWDKRADLTLNVTNPFTRYWPYRSTITTPTFTEVSEYRSYQRAFRLSFGYRFGDAKGGGPRQRKSINNDDVKGGGGGQQGGGQ